MVRILIALLSLTFVSCDYDIVYPSPVTNVTNTNTNTNTVSVDVHDLVNFAPSFPPTVGTPNPSNPETPLAVPPGSEAIARSVANANPTLIAQSCQATYGQSAWAFMDLLVSTLKAQDSRWGYVCKTTCSEFSQDTIGYRATADNTGLWAVDVIGNHCGVGPTFTWNVVGYDAARQWANNR